MSVLDFIQVVDNDIDLSILNKVRKQVFFGHKGELIVEHSELLVSPISSITPCGYGQFVVWIKE